MIFKHISSLIEINVCIFAPVVKSISQLKYSLARAPPVGLPTIAAALKILPGTIDFSCPGKRLYQATAHKQS